MSKSLKRILTQEDAIIFLGSGVSRWSGLPSWEGLIDDLAEFLEQNDIDSTLVRQEAESGDLLQSASYGFLKLTAPQRAEFVRQVCKTGEAKPSSLHQAIMKLGPSCFISTNYDDLIEQAYLQHRSPPVDLRIVLNIQLLEQAEITHAQARNFIFKPHGDARSGESVILSREQYRMLLPEGKLSATLNTLKTLLQSRPVLFVGFGLRDPDFLYLRDILANIYRGGMRDHYAVIADPTEDQVTYWRMHFGIHLIGYETADSGRDHNELLKLMESLSTNQLSPASAHNYDLSSPVTVLAIARYASSCIKPIAVDRFNIHVRPNVDETKVSIHLEDYYNWSVDRLLTDGPNSLILIGEPGAGKSFAIQEAVNRIATELQDACLKGQLTDEMQVPVFLDLKLFNGDLIGQIGEKFPEGLTLDHLYKSVPVTVYLDSYNEMPRNFRESRTFDQQLDALRRAFPNINFIIGSRTHDGLERLDLDFYHLSAISNAEIERKMASVGISLSQTHFQEIKNILRIPFFFSMVNRSALSLDLVRNPTDFYEQYILGMQERFEKIFGSNIEIIPALRRHAYFCLEEGIEAFSLSDLTKAINFAASNINSTKIIELTNWLASDDFIVPIQGGRAAFVHQSITEYLAASELAGRLTITNDSSASLITYRRWDYTIFLTLGLIDSDHAEKLLSEIVATDIVFALKAVRYVEHDREKLIGSMLEIVANTSDGVFNHEVQFAFDRLPFSASHEQPLRRVLSSIPFLKGNVYVALAKIVGQPMKEELIDLLFNGPADFEHRRIGEALSFLVDLNDFQPLVEKTLALELNSLDDDESDDRNRVESLAIVFRRFSPTIVRLETVARLNEFKFEQQRIIAALICCMHRNSPSTEGLAMVIEVVRARLPKNLFEIYLAVEYTDGQQSFLLGAFDDDLFESIIYYIENGDQWAVKLLITCADDKNLRERVQSLAEQKSGILQTILEYCATGESSALFSAIDSWASGQNKVSDLYLLMTIDFCELEWGGRHNQFKTLLAGRNLDVASLILGGSVPPNISGLDNIDMGNVEQWIDWIVELQEESVEGDNRRTVWISYQLAYLVAHSSELQTKAQLLVLLDEGTAPIRSAIAKFILPYIAGLALSDLSPTTVEFLKSLIIQGNSNLIMGEHVFAKIGDEAFVKNELFPLALKHKSARNSVVAIAKRVGERLGIRLNVPPFDGESEKDSTVVVDG